MKNNPYIISFVVILAVVLYAEHRSSSVTAQSVVFSNSLLKPQLLKNGFHAHQYDKSSRSLTVTIGNNNPLLCSLDKGSSFFGCKDGDKLGWSAEFYNKKKNILVKTSKGDIHSFTPHFYNPNLSFHKCDRYLKNTITEKVLREVIEGIIDHNLDGSIILCLDAKQTIELRDGPLNVNKDMAIIGTHFDAPKIKSIGSFPVIMNERNTLFLYNLNLESTRSNAEALSLGIGSYLGADNLNIIVSSNVNEGIECMGCDIDGEGIILEVINKKSKTYFKKPTWTNSLTNVNYL